MTVAKSIEVTSSSSESFDDAVKTGISKVSETVNNIQSAWVKDQYVTVENGSVKQYRTVMKVTFLVD